MIDEAKHEDVGQEVIPVVEEQVEVGTKEVEGRTVTVRTRPISDTQLISRPVTRDRVSVERVPVDKVVESLPEAREESGVTVIPVVEERLVVTKQLVLKEEIHLCRTQETSVDERVVEVRRTEVDIVD